jgi:hypothetical protein
MAEPPPDTQITPQGEVIPVPTRGEFDANLDKLLKAPQPPGRVRGKRGRHPEVTGSPLGLPE